MVRYGTCENCKGQTRDGYCEKCSGRGVELENMALREENARLRAELKHVNALLAKGREFAAKAYPELSDEYKGNDRVGDAWKSYKLGYDAAKAIMVVALAEVGTPDN